MREPLGYVCLLLSVLHPSDSLVCRSIDVRNNVADLEDLRNCTVVEGSVQIVLMNRFVEADFEPYSFPELREVTEYMLFYRVNGLQSLGRMFPNLERIGGDKLFVKDFALVVYDMASLREIGLSNLKEITNGSVNISKNPNLCFVNTVKWAEITKRGAEGNYGFNYTNKATCSSCPEHCQDNACWNATQCQFETNVSKCHELCVGGCSTDGPEGCYTCKGFYDLEGNCVDKCPNNTYKYLNRRCVTREECINMIKASQEKNSSDYYVVHEDECLDSCPPGYEPSGQVGECRPCRDSMERQFYKLCNGAVIARTSDAQRLQGCTYINGSIEIIINSNMSSAVRSVLEKNLGSIEQIRGYLKVKRSSVTDLNFLKNLSVIQGKNESNALVIHDNKNLQDLWDWKVKKNLTIVTGRVYFHYNRKLCMHHIEKLLEVIGYGKNVTDLEIGRESNGDKFPCNASHINIIDITKTFDLIEFRVKYTEALPVRRFVVFYTKDPDSNITMFDEFDQCSDYGWRTKDILEVDSNDNTKGVKVILTELEPNTTYVFYVTTYTINSQGARSEMCRVTTMPGTPSEVTRLRAVVNSSTEIHLLWEPPNHVNGKLLEYVITWSELNEDSAFINQRNYCSNPMDPETESNEPEEIRPQVKVDNQSCCTTPQKRLLPKSDFEMLCKNFANVPKGFPDITKSPSCESYFYSYIYNSPFPSIQVKIPVKANFNESFTGNKLGRSKSASASQNLIFDNDPIVKNTVKSKRLSASYKNVSLKELKQFQNYVISVKACREAHENETDTSKLESNRCSKSEIITVRTKGNNESDAIPQDTVKVPHVIKEGTLEVKWGPPEKPNGLIVAFDIEYRNIDLENPKYTKECLTHAQYENNNNKHVIHGLSPGRYEIRVRAITLFGEGPFTKIKTFNVEHKRNISRKSIGNISRNIFWEIVFIVLAVFVILLVLVMFIISSYFPRPSNYNIVIATVNPNYHYVPDHYEIDRDDAEFGAELGIGRFGKVYEGRWKSKNLRCAIKTVNEDATVDNEQEFLIEASVMKSMTNAYFIVQIYGVVSKGRPPLVLMELMEHGDLKTYLRQMRETSPITNAMMIEMALEIADGMAYMEAHKFVHRDLAARNCMVTSDLTIKVGDFGMARDIYETDYYRKRSKGFLPIRWMAPESLKDGEFTSHSDIWSYGVVLWEIVTMAEQPYQGFSNDQVLNEVMTGRRLGIPKYSPLPLKALMAMCWRITPARRSSFMNIVGTLEYYHDDEFRKVAYYHSEEAVAARKGLWEYVEMKPLVGPMVRKSPTTTTYRLSTVDEESGLLPQ